MSSVSMSESVPIAAEAEGQVVVVVVGVGGKPLGILILGLMDHPMDLPRVHEALGREVVGDRPGDVVALYPYPSRGLFRSLCRGFCRGLARDTCPYPGPYLDPCLCLRLGHVPCHLDNLGKTYSDLTDSRRHIFSKMTCIYHSCHIPAMTCSSRRRADMICRSRPAVDRALDHGPGPGLDHDRAHDLGPDTCPSLSPSFLVLVVSRNHPRSSGRSARMERHLHRHEQVRAGHPRARHVVEGRRLGRHLRIHLCARLCPYHLSEGARNPDRYNFFGCVHYPDHNPCLGLGSGRGRGHHTSENETYSSLCCSRACLDTGGN
jgi:hypothetical protein